MTAALMKSHLLSAILQCKKQIEPRWVAGTDEQSN